MNSARGAGPKKKKKKPKNADAFDVNANQMDTKTQMYVICFIS